MSIQLKKKLDGILANWGHNVHLQRKVDGKFERKLEKHTVRHMNTSRIGVPRIREERAEGVVNTVDMIYYFRAESRPKEGDRIYDGNPAEGANTFIIDYAVPMRGRGGVMIFYQVGATRETPK